MSVAGIARLAVGLSEISEKNGEIIISGVSADSLARDMKFVWATSKVASSMFTKVKWGEIRIPSFFALELKFILEKLLHAKRLYTPKHKLRAMIRGINENTWVANTLVPPRPWVDYSKLKEIIYDSLLPHQMEFLNSYENTVPRYGLKGMLLSAAPGAGKAQPLDAKVLTPDGWRLMGELMLGDYVCTPDGGKAQITGIFPQGVKDMYRTTFSDGRSTRACGEHLWDIQYKDNKGVKDTLTIRELMLNETVTIPLVQGQTITDNERATLEVALSNGVSNEEGVITLSSTFVGELEEVQTLVRRLGGTALLTKQGNTYSLAVRQSVESLAFESIEYIGRVEAQCIMVDHPDHLYITDDYIVTHNTLSDCGVALMTKATKVIIVCPKNAVYRVWQKTLNEEFKVPQNPFVCADGKPLDPSKKWHIFHYETLDAAIELAKTFRNEKVCIILDECHNFNEIKSLRTERFLRLCTISGSRDIVWASGTPVKAMGFETIPLLKSIDPLFTPVAEAAFRKMFGKDAKRTLDILAHRLGLITHVTPKTQFMSTKPEYETIYVQMPNSNKYTLSYLSKVMQEFIDERTKFYKQNHSTYRAIYDQCIDIHRRTLVSADQLNQFKLYQNDVNHIIKNGLDVRRDGDIAVRTNKYEKERILPTLPPDLKKKFVDAKSVVKYVELKVRGECLGRILTRERIQCHVDMIKYVDFKGLIGSVKKKTIIFTSYVKVVDATFAHLSETGYKPVRVYGDNSNELSSIVKKFGAEPDLNPLVTTYQSLSTAVPLTMANGVIFLNNPWRSFEKDQAIARAHRIGQDEQVYGFDILLDTGSEVNISSRSLDIMQWSKEQVDAIMGTVGDVNIGLESNGFVTEATMDVNEAIEDVRWETEPSDVNVVPLTEVEAEDATLHYSPELRRFWGK